ncbi:MAG: glucosaminidase domain-containing protein [Alphaproteobacteria bacterium]
MSAESGKDFQGTTLSPAYGRQRIGFAVALACGVALAVVFSQSGEAPPRPSTVTSTAQKELAVERTKPIKIKSHSIERLTAHFESLGYTLAKVRDGAIDVPRVLPDSVPQDIEAMQNANERKRLFLRMVLPLALVINDSILQDRARIEAYRDRAETGKMINARESTWLSERFKEYKVEPGNFDALLHRVDIVPVSLVLAQAAVESGWGTSRFAREGNALFGQWTWSKDDDAGIVPENRADGKTHKVKAFQSPVDAVASYMRNLNTHRAYRDLRKRRAALRQNNTKITGTVLAEGLERYSEKGYAYVELIKQIIRSNRLGPLDEAGLAPTLPSLPRVTRAEKPAPDLKG